jgi:Fe-S-cluster containining protein
MKSSDVSPVGTIIKIYRLYEKALAHIDVVCKEGCAVCCTCNVVVTSLEASFLVHSLDAKTLAGVKQRLAEKFPGKRYIPKMTTNQFASYCVSGQEIPEEENDPDWGKCPFLEKDRCTLYPVRPFGCRSMMSQVDCGKTGFAQVPPLALTITNIFLQYIEHLDSQGFSGNLSDMVGFYLENNENFDKTQVFIKNMKIQALLVPPEHRTAVAPLLKQIAALT